MKTIVFTFGRMNPPTSGHELLVSKLKKTALRKRADIAIYLSQSQDPKKNPLPYLDKVRYAKVAFGPIVKVSKARTVIEVLKELDKEYDNVIMVVGSDRVQKFDKLLNNYNQKEYTFDSIEVVSAGARDPDAEDVSGMSASKMRELAANGDLKSFTLGLPKALQKRAEEVFMKVRKGMRLTEDVMPDVKGDQPAQYYKGMKKKTAKSRAQQFKRGAKLPDDDPKSYKPAPGDADAETKPSKYTKKYKQMYGEDGEDEDPCWDGYKQVGMKKGKGGKPVPNCVREKIQLIPMVEQEVACPTATQNVDVNTKNRNLTRRNHMYGPLNVSEPGDYWNKLADKWNTTVDAAKKSNCGSCVAFDISPRMKDCMPGEVSEGAGELGYCWMHHFKCHSKRSCDTWASGGPITKDDRSYEWQEKAFNEEIELVTEKQIEGLKKKSKKSGIPYGILKKVYDRGMAAWKTGHRPGATQHQWAFARVNSFIVGGKTRTTADADLWAKAKKAKKEEFTVESLDRIFEEFIELEEKATSVAQQKLMALALQYKRGELSDDEVSDEVKELAGSMSEKDLEDFASTKHKGLPDKKEAVSPAQQAAIAIAKKEKGEKPKNEEADLEEIKIREPFRKGNTFKYQGKQYTVDKVANAVLFGTAKDGTNVEVDMYNKLHMVSDIREEDLGEAKRKPPFDPDPKPKKTPRNSDGTKTSGMSRARQLAKRGIKMKESKDSKAYSRASKELRSVKDPIEGANLKKLAIILDRLGKVSLINSGDLLNQLNKIVMDMDTDVREVVFRILKKNGLMEEKRVASFDEVTEEEIFELDEKYSWNDVNKALTKANWMRGNPKFISDLAKKFNFKSGNDKKFSDADIKKAFNDYGIKPATQHDIMKNMNEEVEIAGQTYEYMDLCPAAVEQFKKDLEKVGDVPKVRTAMKAVDQYLEIEGKAIDRGFATQGDVDEITRRIEIAKAKIKEAGLMGHDYHQGHLNTVKDMVKSDIEEGRKPKEEEEENIVMQLRKVVDLRGMKPVQFADGSTMKIDPKDAKLLMNLHQALAKPIQKQALQQMMGRSKKDFMNALKLATGK